MSGAFVPVFQSHRQGRWSFTLLDIQLPEMDGYTVASRFRSESALADVPIIAVTSYAMVGDREKSIEAGCTGYIEKPIDPDTFISELEKYLLAGRKPTAHSPERE